MKLALSDIFQVSLCAFGYLYATSDITLAQITPDNSVNTTVNQQGNIAEITGGTTKQDNLFHSFREFSVGSGNEAFFNNAADISNIFSRVTGGQISNIDGLIRANGSANLFLINPAGIIFGEGARLNIGGSFYGSSADSILFPDGIEFNATDTSAQPILSINAPIGLSFRDNPREIVNQSVANDLGLQVSSGETLSLIGGDVKLEGGLISAPGGLVELGGLLAAGEIVISETGGLSFPEGIARSNVELTNDAAVDVRADSGGFININAKDLLLADTSELLAGIAENMGSVDTQAGDITINATDSVTLIGDEVEEDSNAGIEELDTSIRNFVGLPLNRREDSSEESSAVGNGGSIFVNTNLLQISNRASISAKVYGSGNSGDVNVTAQNISVDAGAILSQIRSGGTGNSGNINLDVNSLSVKDQSFVVTDNNGNGNAGDININATDSVFVGGEIFNALISELGEDVVGEAGDINIDTKFLTIDGTQGGAQLLTTSKGKGNAGNVNLNARETISLLGGGGAILPQVDPGAEGNGGNVTITTKSLDVQGDFTPDNVDSGRFVIQASSQGVGDGGDITINASERISLNNASILSQVLEQSTGNAGTITFDSPIISIDGTEGGAQLLTTSEGKGNAGNVNLNARETISLLGGGGKILSDVEEGVKGNAGDVNITTKSLDIQGDFTPDDVESGRFLIQASSRGIGDGGDITINASERISLNNASIFSQVLAQSTGNAGTIAFDSPIISIDGTQGGVQLLTTSEGKGNAGNVNLDARETISLLGGGEILSQVGEGVEGNAGDINITTKSLDIQGDFTPDDLTNGRFIIQSSSRGVGDSGDITINASEKISLNNASILSQVLEQSTGNTGTITFNSPIISFNDYSIVSNSIIGQGLEDLGGDISINTDTLSIKNFSILASSTRNNAVGNGGNIDIQSNEITIAEGGVISAFTENDSNGGTIAINSNNLAILSGGKIVTQTDGGGNAGNITLDITEEITINGSNPALSGELEPFEDNILIELEPATGLFANTSNKSMGNSGNITIDTPNSLNLVDRAQISVDSRGLGNSGTLTIQTDALNLDNGFISAATVSGNAGLLSIDVNGNILLKNSSRISARAFNDANGGNINIDTNFIVAFPNGNNDIIANAEEGQGGNININAKSIFGINEQPLNDLTNDINASSEFGLDGTVSITTPEVDAIQGATESLTNIVAPEQTTTQACQANSEPIAASNLIINGRGGLQSKPDSILNSDNIFIDGENTNQAAYNLPQVINTSQGHITLARGVVKTPDGRIVLSPYPTDNQAERLPSSSANCSSEFGVRSSEFGVLAPRWRKPSRVW